MIRRIGLSPSVEHPSTRTGFSPSTGQLVSLSVCLVLRESATKFRKWASSHLPVGHNTDIGEVKSKS